jgi:hypothetical protein
MTDISFRKIECRSASGGFIQPNFTKEITRSCANECGARLLQLRAAGLSTVQPQNGPFPARVQGPIGFQSKMSIFGASLTGFSRFGFCAGPVAVSIVAP